VATARDIQTAQQNLIGRGYDPITGQPVIGSAAAAGLDPNPPTGYRGSNPTGPAPPPPPPPTYTNPGIDGGVGGGTAGGDPNAQQPTINGVNLGDPGQGETYYDQNAGRYSQPTQQQGLYGSVMGQFGTTAPATTNNQQGVFGQAQGALAGPTGAGSVFQQGMNTFGVGGGPTTNNQQGVLGAEAPGLMGPSGSQRFAGGALNTFGAGGGPTSNNQQANYNQFEANKPNIAQDPGLDPYYSNAIRQGNENIDKTMAARGLYGSSAANDATQEMTTNLRADQAKNEAQYNLQRLGEQRNWEGLGGNLAQGADTQSLGQSANQRGWVGQQGTLQQAGDMTGTQRAGMLGSLAGGADTQSIGQSANQRGWYGAQSGAGSAADQSKIAGFNTLGNLASGADTQTLGQAANQRNWLGELSGMAGGADTSGLNQLNAGMNAATGAQNLGMNRFNTAFGSQNLLDSQSAGIMGNAYNNMFQNDQGLFGNQQMLGLGAEGQNVNMTGYLANQGAANTSDLISGVGRGVTQLAQGPSNPNPVQGGGQPYFGSPTPSSGTQPSPQYNPGLNSQQW
jgi:hypothetical protein